MTLIIITLAAVLGLPAIASAVIPNGTTYNACYVKTTGALRLIDKSSGSACKSTETAVSWSKNAASSGGAPDVWKSAGKTNIGGSYRAVTSVAVPAGKYLVTWTVQAAESVGFATDVFCFAHTSAGNLPTQFGSIGGDAEGEPNGGVLAYTGVVNASGAISVQCAFEAPGASGFTVSASGSLTALEVGAVH